MYLPPCIYNTLKQGPGSSLMHINISVHHVAAIAMSVYHNVIDALVLCVV